MIVKHPETVVKAIDFVTYGCSGWACFAAYVNHYSTVIAIVIAFVSLLVSILYKHLNYKTDKRKLDIMFKNEKENWD